jgi:hypothetical protein
MDDDEIAELIQWKMVVIERKATDEQVPSLKFHPKHTHTHIHTPPPTPTQTAPLIH